MAICTFHFIYFHYRALYPFYVCVEKILSIVYQKKMKSFNYIVKVDLTQQVFVYLNVLVVVYLSYLFIICDRHYKRDRYLFFYFKK